MIGGHQQLIASVLYGSIPPSADNDRHNYHENENVGGQYQIGILAVDKPFGQSYADLHEAWTVWIAVFGPVVSRLVVSKRLVGLCKLFEFLFVATFVRMHGFGQLTILFFYFFFGSFTINAEYAKRIVFFVLHFDLGYFECQIEKQDPAEYQNDFTIYLFNLEKKLK